MAGGGGAASCWTSVHATLQGSVTASHGVAATESMGAASSIAPAVSPAKAQGSGVGAVLPDPSSAMRASPVPVQMTISPEPGASTGAIIVPVGSSARMASAISAKANQPKACR